MAGWKKYEEKELTLIKFSKTYEKAFYGNKPYQMHEKALFRDDEGMLYEYKYDPKAKTEFASSLTDMPSNTKVKVNFNGEEHYHKTKSGEKEWYVKMSHPKMVKEQGRDEKENEEPELLF